MSEPIKKCEICNRNFTPAFSLWLLQIYKASKGLCLEPKALTPHAPTEFSSEINAILQKLDSFDREFIPTRKELVVLYENFFQKNLSRSLIDCFFKKAPVVCNSCTKELEQVEKPIVEKYKKSLKSLNLELDKLQQIKEKIRDELGEDKLTQICNYNKLEKEFEKQVIAEIKSFLEPQLTDEQQFEQIKQYFLDNHIKQVSLTNSGDLLIEYQNGTTKTLQANSQSLHQIKSYLQSQGKQSISYQELTNQTTQPKPTNWTPWIIGGLLTAGIVIGLVIWLVWRKKSKKANEEQ